MPTVAIIGASTSRAKFGNKSVRAHMQAGYDVFPVHPTEKVIEGLQAYPSIPALPVKHLDRVSMYLPPKLGIKIISELKSLSLSELWLNPGTESDEILELCRNLGINAITDCSIVALGLFPSQFPDD